MAGIGDIQREANKAADEGIKVSYEQVSAVIEGIRQLIYKGEKITLQDFGTYSIKDVKAKTARNPRTGDPVDVPAKKVPKFVFNYNFRTKVNEKLNTPAKKPAKAKGKK